MAEPTGPTSHSGETARLGMWDAVSIIVGIVVGTSIYKAPNLIFGSVSNAWVGLGAWVLGGLLSFIGALCYAELATTYPKMGGDYVYLTRAYGKWVGFQFGWAQLAVILTGSIGVMAFAFGDYAAPLFGCDSADSVWFAAGSVIVLSVMNLAGVVFGKWMQNFLSVVKVIGLLAIVVVGFGWGGDVSFALKEPPKTTSFGFAMIMVLYAFGGWNDAAFVASEVKDRHRNIPKALFLGIGGITLVYLLVNLGYLWVLGFEGLRGSGTPAADVLQKIVGDNGARAMSVLVMLSALGAINGLIFTGSRIYTALGREHSVFAFLGRWDPRLSVPVWSILVQGIIAVLLILGVGTESGRNGIDSRIAALEPAIQTVDPALQQVGSWLEAIDISCPPRGELTGLPWKTYFGGFETLVAGTAPVFWLFFLLTGLSMFTLRANDPHVNRPFKVPLFPVTPFIFCNVCLYMLYSSLVYAKALSLIGLVPLAIGIPLYFFSKPTDGRSA